MVRFDPAEAPSLISAARRDAGLTQATLAARAGISQPNLAAIERGSRAPSAKMLARILEVADYRPSIALELHRDRIRAAAAARQISGLRVFGSMLRGEDRFDSDIDLFVDTTTGAGMIPLAAFAAEVERLTGFPVDVVDAESAAATALGAELLASAVPL
ncbi:helix-turn-helix domain-containing protein [Agromyces italicus]|uniref:helix-turn-helix domain-containing protein n=1 Tax=Agromyces italicus TaxID=279572 RepID=UPI0003B70462|nr:helix-turn-helix domain-containing protein [Agromyces italicus]